MTAAYPLHWPAGRLRTPASARRRANFSQRVHNGRFEETKALSIAASHERLQFEVDRLDARNVILSTNQELRLDGRPRSGNGEPADPGAALWFTLRKRDMVLACDRWDRLADNIAAIAKHIEALRGIERWGVGSLEQAFAGYEALPKAEAPDAGGKRDWWIVLGVDRAASMAEIEAAWRERIRAAHPDNGGSKDEAAAINRARDEARAERTYNV